MVITFSNIKGSAGGGGGATGGTVSGITLWSDETTKAYIDNALSGVTDVLSAYTKTEDFATINGSAITSGGNIVVEATPYTAGTNIDITDHIISVTGITVPTKVSELVNDSGYITTADTQNFVTSGDVQTQINNSISGKADSSAVTAQISAVKQEIEAKIPSKVSDLQNDLNFASTGDVESMISGFTTSADVKTQIEGYNYINSGQAQTQIDNSISGKLNTDIFTAYTANTQTELNNKQDASGMTEYATTAFTENTYAKIGDIPTKTSDLTNDSGFITNAALSGYATEQYVDNSVSGKVDNSALTQYYTSAQTDAAIQNATNGLASEEWVNNQGFLKEHQDISGKLDTSVFTAYTANTQTELNNKQDASAMTAYATTAFTESTYLKEHQSLSAYTPTSGFSTINGSAITEGGNIVVEETPYSGGTNIDITDHIISVTGITVPTKLSELTNDSGYINSGQAQTQIDNAVSGKLDTDIFTAYTANTKTEINNAVSGKVDSSRVDEIEEVTASALVELHNTKQDILVSGTNIKTINNESILGSGNIVIQGGSGSDYSAGANINISTDNVISVTGITVPTKLSELANDEGYVNSGEVETQITNKGYITGFTESDPVFQASAASGITSQNITNWNNKLDSSALTPYYTSAQTDTAISNATSGKQDTLVSGVNIKTINNESLLGSGNIEIQGGSSIKNYRPLQVEFSPYYSFIDAYEISSIGTRQFYERIAFDTINGNSIIHQSDNDKVNWTIPTSTSALTNDSGYITTADTQNFVTSGDVQTQIDNAVSGKQDTLVSGTNIKTINNQSLLGSGNIEIQGGSGGSSYTAGNNIDITNDVISVTGLATINGSAITEGGNIVIQGGSGGGSNIIELTQAEYDALTAYTEDAIYVITDSQAINMDNYVTTGALGSYYTSAETDTAISNAVSGKTDKISVTESSSGYKFPKWNNQGCITGTYSTAYQASQSINGSSRYLYSTSSSSLPTIYAPTSAGSAGQPLLSNGSGAPVWGSYKFQFISQSQYDALATKDSTTIYFIINEN